VHDARLPELTGTVAQQFVAARCDTKLYYKMVDGLRSDTSIIISGADLSDSQVHDCQRLITGGTLGPLAGIMVSTARVSQDDFSDGVVVAEIVNYTGPAYTELGIEPGLNCLWLQGSGTAWQAAIIQPRGAGCTADLPRPLPDQLLAVTRLTYRDTIYPSTGRWMWDGHNQYIGIRCGSGWCEMGKPGFTPTARISHVEDIPGWYDEQLLSYVSANGQLALSGILGRISPAPGLLTAPDAEFRRKRGRHVAVVQFTGNDPAVLAKYRAHFRLPADAARGNLYHRTYRPFLQAERIEFSPDQQRWSRVLFNPHATHAGRGSVRWAWHELDEFAWYPCPMGCCTTAELQLM
jgi:hypothetical protein